MIPATEAKAILKHASSVKNHEIDKEVERVSKLIRIAATFKRKSVMYTPKSQFVDAISLAKKLKAAGYKVQFRQVDKMLKIIW